VVWRDGIGGYRSEEIIAVTDTGYDKLTSYGYTPFEEPIVTRELASARGSATE
jgi:hypothetical protein